MAAIQSILDQTSRPAQIIAVASRPLSHALPHGPPQTIRES
jgi:hypothetical protein